MQKLEAEVHKIMTTTHRTATTTDKTVTTTQKMGASMKLDARAVIAVHGLEMESTWDDACPASSARVSMIRQKMRSKVKCS